MKTRKGEPGQEACVVEDSLGLGCMLYLPLYCLIWGEKIENSNLEGDRGDFFRLGFTLASLDCMPYLPIILQIKE